MRIATRLNDLERKQSPGWPVCPHCLRPINAVDRQENDSDSLCIHCGGFIGDIVLPGPVNVYVGISDLRKEI